MIAKKNFFFQRTFAAWVALVLGILILGVKFWAYSLTGSQAVFSDAMESIVNVVTAFTALIVIVFANRPADKEHPYGHGKIEYFSSTLEGGLIGFAAIFIVVEAVNHWSRGLHLQNLDLGLIIVTSTAVLNAVIGIYLKKVGDLQGSITLRASGTHLLSDFWTSVSVVLGLIVVNRFHILWLDPAVAVIIAIHLAWSSYSIVRESIGGLLDENDEKLIAKLSELFTEHTMEGIIRIHYTRIIRSGRFHHIDAHVVLPEFWTVTEAHEKTHEFERKILASYPFDGEFHFHTDPCRKAYCQVCDLSDCPVRAEKFQRKIPFSVQELISPTEPAEYLSQRQ